MTQSPVSGGFSVVDVRLKVYALLGQWVRIFVSSPSGWCVSLSSCFVSRFGVYPLDVFTRPFSFDPKALPPFYQSLLLAWRSLNGSFSHWYQTLVYGSSTPLGCAPVLNMSTSLCYRYLLSENMVPLHCVEKFNTIYGNLDWPATWRSLSLFHLDRQVTDINWKIAHGVLYTAQRLASFGLSVPLPCFCGAPVETPEHLFFYCPLAQSVLSWIQSLLFGFSSMCPVLLLRHLLFGLNSNELRATPCVFIYLLNLCKFFVWQSRNDFRFRNSRPGAVDVIARVKTRLRFRLNIFFRRFTSTRRRDFFHRQWGARGTVASVVNDTLVFTI